MRRFLILSLLILCAACSSAPNYSINNLLIDPIVFDVKIDRQADGIYRGSFYDSGIEQVGIQFKVIDNHFIDFEFTSLSYKNGDYLSFNATQSQKAILFQFEQLIVYLKGKPLEALNDLYNPENIVNDNDAVTGATIRSNKLISAIHDGFNRKPFEILLTTKFKKDISYVDGLYRGFFYMNGQEQIAIEFELNDNQFVSFEYRALRYLENDYLGEELTLSNYRAYLNYISIHDFLINKDVNQLYNLYYPETILTDFDVQTSATFKSNGLISAIGDALNRNPYILTSTTRFENDNQFVDGTYRGVYYDNGIEQVNVHFILKDNQFQSITLKGLSYDGVDYLSSNLSGEQERITVDYGLLANYLIQKDINSINELYDVSEIDALTSSTIKTNKLISALWNGLNRNVYK